MYVQPVYVQSSGSTSFPLLKKVLVAFGDQVGFANTLDEALDQVFGGNSGASAGDAENSGNTSQSGDGQNSDGQNGTDSGDSSESNGNANGSGTNEGKDQNGSSSQSGSQSPELQQALKDAAQAMKDSQSAMKNGDWTAYGEAQKQLEEALNKAIELDGGK